MTRTRRTRFSVPRLHTKIDPEFCTRFLRAEGRKMCASEQLRQHPKRPLHAQVWLSKIAVNALKTFRRNHGRYPTREEAQKILKNLFTPWWPDFSKGAKK